MRMPIVIKDHVIIYPNFTTAVLLYNNQIYMYLKDCSPFFCMVIGAVGGALLGILFGLGLGLLISNISFYLEPNSRGGPESIGGFLGMGAGAVIGSVLGAIYSNKK